MAKTDLTAARLRELLHYNPKTGVFTRAIDAHKGRWKAGEIVGCTGVNGYTIIHLKGDHYLGHRLAWMYVHGVWPNHAVDHVNAIRTDNRIENLRDADPRTNAQNIRSAHKDNKTGFLGVIKTGKRWGAQIYINGIRQHLGTFDSAEIAHSAYLAAKRSEHDGCTI